jgi:hypothetical protein
MKKTLIAAIVVLSAAASPARAGEPSGLSFGLRTGYGIPLGEAADGVKLKDLASGAVPVQLECGWRFDEHWLAGAYYSWGPTFVADGAETALAARGATDVSGHFEQRIGVQGIYTFSPMKKLAPWAGVGVGYEWTRYADAKVDGREVEVGLRGFEAMVQAGADYRLNPRLSVGPFATFNVGQYRSTIEWVENGDDLDTSADASIGDRGVHEWIQLGIRGTFDL